MDFAYRATVHFEHIKVNLLAHPMLSSAYFLELQGHT
jgi:hypothetical protein